MMHLEPHLQQVFGSVPEVMDQSTFSSGMAFPIVRVHLKTLHGVQDVVVKVFPAGFERAFEKEAWALKNLPAVGVSVPPLLGVSQVAETRAMVMGWVEGTSLMEVLLENEGPWMERFARQLFLLHEGTPALNLPDLQTPASVFQRATQRFDKGFQTRYQSILQWTEKQLENTVQLPPVLLHQDYHPWNVLVRPSRELVVLDWDWSTGDPREDLAWTRLVLQKAGHPQLAEAFTANYRQFCPEAGEHLQAFDVLAQLRWLQTLERPSARQEVTPEVQAWLNTLKQDTHRMLQEITGASPHS